ncbi:cold shock domain-containing protein [Legionella pneumophila]|uniref:cold-shock protein n=1 Tax=Legionella pneumophila TaxID=446 RepID=UPI0024B7EEDD|nr:cold shock domain-containing protein [Legionella pneumophila]MDI9824468.1 cold shock domain-containing protein [Legionella pneumophila]
MSEKLTGIVKWFNNAKGFGFIIKDNVDYFVHYKSIIGDGYKTLEEGSTVKFQVSKSERGLKAEEVEAT